ncbi:phosphoesterase [Paenibacillus antarcticus]|uniref:Phosphoesterase n=1 Tax=Paenibacillus antarcticus TaxID=253703 RepID=A0A162MGY6_9BACL|nr:phosphoesterase [Paenibacillus antarcticus]
MGAGLLSSSYAWLWEPRQLSLELLELEFKRLPPVFDGLKVVQFSDLHLGFHSYESHLKNLMESIMSQSPDVICFTGDIVDNSAEPLAQAIPYLTSLKAPMGKYAILGNHDHWGQPGEIVRMLEASGFVVLQNSNVLLRRNESMIAIVGLEDLLIGLPDPEKALKGIPEGTFSLLLMHEPDYADTAALYPFDIQISGHSHGGQVRLPMLGAVITPIGSKRYIQGLYHLESSAMKLYVNRGIGVTQLPIRFLCRPELTVFTFKKSGM